jgi:hypothetical protein
MSNRFDPQPPQELGPAPRNGAPHPAIRQDDPQSPPAAPQLPPMSQNVPECPNLQNKSSANPAPHQVTHAIDADLSDPSSDLDANDLETAEDEDDGDDPVPDYQPAQPPAPDEPPLSHKQRQAIHLLLQGLSDTAVAKRLGLNRKTIYRWKWYHPRFYNTLDEAQRQAWNEAYGLLRSSILQSALKLNHLIKKGKPEDAIKAAKVLLSAPVLARLEQ